jgi:hypothetical protein
LEAYESREGVEFFLDPPGPPDYADCYESTATEGEELVSIKSGEGKKTYPPANLNASFKRKKPLMNTRKMTTPHIRRMNV